MISGGSRFQQFFAKFGVLAFLGGLGAVLALLPAWSQGFSGVVSFGGTTMGAPYRVSWVPSSGGKSDSPEEIAQRLDAWLRDFDATLTTYQADSPLLRWNRARETRPLAIPRLMAQVLALAFDVHQESGGAYDVTVLPWLRLWGFAPGSEEQKSEPSLAEQAEARARSGMEKLTFDRTRLLLAKRHPEMEIDLNSIAPGYAADQLGIILEQQGIRNYLIDVGGELVARGQKPDGLPWVVGVETPSAEYAQGVEERVSLRDEAIATSGSYRRVRWLNGRRLTHVIDPRRGRPVEHAVVSVTVIRPTAALADAWATAFLVLSLEEGRKLADEKRIPVFWIEQGADGLNRVSRSQAWLAREGRFRVEGSAMEWASGLGQVGVTVAAFLAIFALMAVGVIFRRKPIQGSCGGIANVMGDSGCDACEKKNVCERTGKPLRDSGNHP